MPDLPSHRAFFGDAERRFVLPADLIVELERKTGTGIGALCKRVSAGEFAHSDMLETIRLALIGGGETPQSAASLVATYAAARPIMEAYPLAIAVLETTMFGKAAKTPKKGAKP